MKLISCPESWWNFIGQSKMYDKWICVWKSMSLTKRRCNHICTYRHIDTHTHEHFIPQPHQVVSGSRKAKEDTEERKRNWGIRDLAMTLSNNPSSNGGEGAWVNVSFYLLLSFLCSEHYCSTPFVEKILHVHFGTDLFSLLWQSFILSISGSSAALFSGFIHLTQNYFDTASRSVLIGWNLYVYIYIAPGGIRYVSNEEKKHK